LKWLIGGAGGVSLVSGSCHAAYWKPAAVEQMKDPGLVHDPMKFAAPGSGVHLISRHPAFWYDLTERIFLAGRAALAMLSLLTRRRTDL
jgi:hypothetical protein